MWLPIGSRYYICHPKWHTRATVPSNYHISPIRMTEFSPTYFLWIIARTLHGQCCRNISWSTLYALCWNRRRPVWPNFLHDSLKIMVLLLKVLQVLYNASIRPMRPQICWVSFEMKWGVTIELAGMGFVANINNGGLQCPLLVFT